MRAVRFENVRFRSLLVILSLYFLIPTCYSPKRFCLCLFSVISGHSWHCIIFINIAPSKPPKKETVKMMVTITIIILTARPIWIPNSPMSIDWEINPSKGRPWLWQKIQRYCYKYCWEDSNNFDQFFILSIFYFIAYFIKK